MENDCEMIAESVILRSAYVSNDPHCAKNLSDPTGSGTTQGVRFLPLYKM